MIYYHFRRSHQIDLHRNRFCTRSEMTMCCCRIDWISSQQLTQCLILQGRTLKFGLIITLFISFCLCDDLNRSGCDSMGVWGDDHTKIIREGYRCPFRRSWGCYHAWPGAPNSPPHTRGRILVRSGREDETDKRRRGFPCDKRLHYPTPQECATQHGQLRRHSCTDGGHLPSCRIRELVPGHRRAGEGGVHTHKRWRLVNLDVNSSNMQRLFSLYKEYLVMQTWLIGSRSLETHMDRFSVT